MKRWIRVLGILVLLAVPSSVLARWGAAETGHYSVDELHWVESYSTKSLWLPGPACYYGQDVVIIFEASKTWTYVLQKGDVRQTMVQTGTAEVYDMDGNLIDTRPFHVTERFFDAGGDASLRYENESGVSYQVSAWWTIPELERYEYMRKIPGVYDYRACDRSGDWECGWISGECEQGWSSEDEGDWSFDWPPHPAPPPHPSKS